MAGDRLSVGDGSVHDPLVAGRKTY